MVERAHRKYRDGREPHAVRLGRQVRRDRHLGDVEFEPAHHPAECLDDHRHLFEVEGARARYDGAVLQRLRVRIRDERALVRRRGHYWIISSGT